MSKLLTQEEKEWREQKKLLLRKLELREDKKAVRRKFFPKPSTTKILMWFLFLNCTVVEVFTGYATLQSFSLAREMNIAPDLTPLVTLIGVVVGEVIAFAVYAVKSLKENTKGGIVYESAMLDKTEPKG